ncbi:MAG: MFS transporter [Rhodospirillales bacterium]
MASSRRIIAFINSGHFATHLLMLIYPTAVLAMAPAMDRPFSEMIGLALGGFILFGAGSMPAGWLADRWSRRHLMVVFFLGLGAATIATGFAQTPLHVAVGLASMGLFASIYHPVGTAMLVSHATRIGRDIGINGVWGNLGVAASALAAGALADWLGWRWAFFVPGMVMIALGLAFAALVPNEPNLRAAARRHDSTFPRAVIIRALGLLVVMTLASGLVFNSISVGFPKLFEERLAWLAGSTFGVGAIVSLVYSVGAVAQLFMGWLVDRYPIKTGMLPIAICMPVLLALAATAEGVTLIVVGVVMILVMFGLVTINDATVAKYSVDAWRGRVYAIRYMITFGVSATAVPLVAYMHGAGGGFTGLFYLLAGFGVMFLTAAAAFPYRPDEIAPRAAPAPAE